MYVSKLIHQHKVVIMYANIIISKYSQIKTTYLFEAFYNRSSTKSVCNVDKMYCVFSQYVLQLLVVAQSFFCFSLSFCMSLDTKVHVIYILNFYFQRTNRCKLYKDSFFTGHSCNKTFNFLL